MGKEQKENTEINQNIEPTQPEKKKKNTPLIIIIIILSLLVLGVGGYFVWNYINENNDTEEKKDKKDKDNEEEPKKDHIESEKKYSLKIYGSKDYLCLKEGDQCSLAFTIPTKTETAKILDAAGRNYVLYLDEEIYLFNKETEKSEEISIPNNAEKYNLLYNYEIDEINGLEFIQNNKTTYYNINEKATLYSNEYEHFYAINEEYVYAVKGLDNYAPTYYLLSTKKEEKPYIKVTDECAFFSVAKAKDGNFILLNTGCVGGTSSSIYSSSAQKITDYIPFEQYDIADTLKVYENNKLKEYNTNGELIKTYENTGNVQSVYKNIYVTIEDNALYIKEYNDQKYKLIDWKDGYYFHSMISGYYDANTLQNEQEKAAGYYFIVQTDNITTEGVEYYFNPETKEIKSWELPEIGGYAKPILYLYPEKETEVTVNFEHEESLTTTYPKFNEEWKVTAKPNGDLYDEFGKYYYGLYWEEDLNHQVDFSTGFYVTKDNAIDFLEEKLTLIGLNDKERNEFIMYWLPILEKNKQSLVYFELTEERDKYNKLQISPTPDSILRVAIHVKKVNEKVDIKEQKITPFTRIGFTVVEWGGVIYK